MKVPFKKPKHTSVNDMEVIPHTVRTKTAKLDLIDPEKVTHTYQTGTLAYPAGHAMREYKDKKRALKQAKQAK